MSDDPRYGGPWYRHGWPWFMVGLLSTTVVAGISTVFIAVRGADPLVVDDYYREGKAINRSLEADRAAAARGARALLRVAERVEVELEITGNAPQVLELELSHATRAELDRRLRLVRMGGARYGAVEDAPPPGAYYATLRPLGPDGDWRLRRRILLPGERVFRLEPSG